MTIKRTPWVRIQSGMYNIKYAQAIEVVDKRLIISFVGNKKPVAFDFRHNLDELAQLYLKLQKLCRCNLPMPEPSKASMKEFSIGGIPIVDADGKLLGIVTNRDLRLDNCASSLFYDFVQVDHIFSRLEHRGLNGRSLLFGQSIRCEDSTAYGSLHG